MNLSLDSRETEIDWPHHISSAQRAKGSAALYCRKQGLNYNRFLYNRRKLKTLPDPRNSKAMFAKVEVRNPVKGTSTQRLPDARWLSELIHNLLVSR